MALHWVDITILAIMGLSILTGLIRGLLKESIAFAAWILAIWLAFNHSEIPANWLKSFIKDGSLRNIAAVILILITTLFVGGLVNMLVGIFVKRSGLSGMDRLLGMGFGLARGIFIVSLILVVVRITSIPVGPYENESRLYAKFNPLVNWLAARMPHIIEQVKGIDKQNNLLDLAIDVGDIEIVDAVKKQVIQPLPKA